MSLTAEQKLWQSIRQSQREGREETLILSESKQPQRSLSVRESHNEDDDNHILHLLSIVCAQHSAKLYIHSLI